MKSDFMQPNREMSIPMFGDLDAKLRDDHSGEFLAQCLEMLHAVGSELAGPIRADASRRHESNLMDGALRAADQVLRSMWAGFHPHPASSGHLSSV
jgi:hypothetical protein